MGNNTGGKKTRLHNQEETNLSNVFDLLRSARVRSDAALDDYITAHALHKASSSANDVAAMAEASFLITQAMHQQDSADKLASGCVRRINKYTEDAFKKIEDEGTLDELISQFTLINKGIKEESKKIKNLKKSIDRAVQMLKLAEDLFKKFRAVV